MENMEIYNKYKTVPQNALKQFNNGKFSGTDINTMWRIKSLTEAFGMCGIGWYFTTKRLWVETTINNEQFAFAEIELFVKVDGEWSMPISGNGGNKLARLTKNGEYSTSDEAFKMAVTDALGVACRNLGFGADVYWDNDRTKYTTSDVTTKAKVTAMQLAKIAQYKISAKLIKKYNLTKIEELTQDEATEAIAAWEDYLAKKNAEAEAQEVFQ